jgi:hypothetical protein
VVDVKQVYHMCAVLVADRHPQPSEGLRLQCRVKGWRPIITKI